MSKKLSVLLVFAVLALLDASHHAEAQSLQVKKQMKEWKEDVTSYTTSAEKKCGKNLAVELDSTTWKNVPEDQAGYSFGEYCGNGCVFAVEMLCGDDLGKQAVTGGIDKVVCQYHGSDDIEVSVANKTMNCKFSLRDMQFQEKAKKQLESKL